MRDDDTLHVETPGRNPVPSDTKPTDLMAESNLNPTTPFSKEKMRRNLNQTLLWVGLYLLAAVAPLGLVLIGAVPRARSFWIELGVALGIVGFSMMALQFITTARFRRIATFFGSDAMLLFHRQAGIIAFVFIFAHPVILFLAQPAYLEYLDVRVNALRTIFLVAAMIALTALIVLSLWRLSFRLNYEWWRLTHAALAVLVMVVGLAHALQVGHYVAGYWKQGLWVALTVIPLGLLAYVRLYKPWRARQYPYRVVEVRPEHGATWTLVLEPDGHDGMTFKAGQYAWITVGDSPFSLQQNPYSFSSSAEEAGRRLAFTMKEFGDFSESIKHLKPGDRAFLEGPYGSFTLEAQPLQGAIFIMGGIGVTPAMSILRTCRDRSERRPLILIYANNTWDEVVYREELDELQRSLNLKVVHVLAEPHEGWEGESGFVTVELIDRHWPIDDRDYHVFVCGPPKMLDVVEKALAKHGIPIWNRSVERFDMV